MRYVVAEGFDARAYLAALPELAGDLPPGAARFATDPGHYDVAGLRCVKDLTIGELLSDGSAGTARIRFTGNPWKHDENLIVEYTGVTRLHVESGEPGETTGPGVIGQVMLDEVLPAPEGCRHEIAGHHGSVVIVCADLTASWQRAPRPDDPPPGSWTAVLKLGDRWNWLGHQLDGTWVVGVPYRRADPAEDRMDVLTSVLGRPWQDVTRQWQALPASAPPLDDVVRHAWTPAAGRAPPPSTGSNAAIPCPQTCAPRSRRSAATAGTAGTRRSAAPRRPACCDGLLKVQAAATDSDRSPDGCAMSAQVDTNVPRPGDATLGDQRMRRLPCAYA